ncbi:hypothetical protein ACROYT_G034325 [Oculina patagonica]
MNFTCNASLANISLNSSNELNHSTSGNNSVCSKASAESARATNPYEDFYKAAFGSSIFIFVVSLTTILANGFLLFVFYRDPLKIFRNATTYFLISLAIVDLLTALSVEPINATCFMLLYFQHPSTKKCRPFMNAGRYFSASTMTASFLIVFFFTVTQYIVVSSPLKYGRLITKKKVLICVSVIYLYSATFWCLHLMGVSPYVQDVMELFIHSYLLAIVTIVFYILLHLAMRKKMAAGKSLEGQSGKREGGKHIQVQRNFVRVNFMLLSVLIVCNMPAAVIWTIRLFIEDSKSLPSAKILIGNLMVDNVLYMKFLLDPFVYAWRMPKYRESLNKLICRRNIGGESSRNGNNNMLAVEEVRDGGLSTVELNKSAITLLSFKYIEESNVPIE